MAMRHAWRREGQRPSLLPLCLLAPLSLSPAPAGSPADVTSDDPAGGASHEGACDGSARLGSPSSSCRCWLPGCLAVGRRPPAAAAAPAASGSGSGAVGLASRRRPAVCGGDARSNAGPFWPHSCRRASLLPAPWHPPAARLQRQHRRGAAAAPQQAPCSRVSRSSRRV